jgi:chitinase
MKFILRCVVALLLATSAQAVVFQAESFTSAFDTTAGNTGGAFRTGNVDIQVTSDVGGGFNVGWIAATEWLAFSGFNVPTTGSYIIRLRVASLTGATASVDLNSGTIQLGNFPIPATGGWQTWTTVSRTVTLNAGTFSLGVFAQTAGWNFNWIEIVPVVAGTAPTVNLTAPANGASFTAPATIALAANATDADGVITRVDFFRDNILIGSDTSAPYSFNWTGVAQGSYSLTAAATDNSGITATSPAVSVSVNPPGGGNPPLVSLTAPANGASFACNASVQLAASASDSDGFVTRVEFFDNAALIGTDTTAPYAATWTAAIAGAHALTARAVDNTNNSTTSPAVNVTVGTCNNNGGIPARVLVGYWHNFDNGSGFIKLRDVSTAWDIVNLSFGVPAAGSTSRIVFTPDTGTSVAELQSDVQIMHGRGEKVLLSIGGANGHVVLQNATQRQEFVDSVTAIIRQYGLDGLDVDFEGSSIVLNGGDTNFANPTTPLIVNLIQALRQIRTNIGPSFVLTMAPETFFVQVGYQAYGGSAGAYLPVIHGVRDILTLLHVQHYNTGSVLALDNVAYSSGNADFHVAMAEMMMRGFPVANTGQTFPGLRPDQVAIGLPANVNAAGSGFTAAPAVQQAVRYLTLGQSFGGSYVLRNPAGYRAFRGLMAWSVNWDRFAGFTFSQPHRQFLNSLPPP